MRDGDLRRFPGRLLIALGLALLAAGCATTYPELPKNLPAEGTGALVLSIASAEKLFVSSNTLKLRKRGGTDGYRVSYIQENMIYGSNRDFEDAASNGTVAVANLPPGEYEVENFYAFRNGYPSTQTFSSRVDPLIPFTIRAGEATYLGEYLAREAKGKNLFGMSVTALIYFVVSDRSDRDLAIAQRKLPSLQSRKVVKQVLAEGQSKTPLFRTTPLPAELP